MVFLATRRYLNAETAKNAEGLQELIRSRLDLLASGAGFQHHSAAKAVIFGRMFNYLIVTFREIRIRFLTNRGDRLCLETLS